MFPSLIAGVTVVTFTLLCIWVTNKLKELYFWKSKIGAALHGTSLKMSTPYRRFAVMDKSLQSKGMYLIRFVPSPKLMLTEPTTAVQFMAKQYKLERLGDYRLGWVFGKVFAKSVGSVSGDDHKRIRRVWEKAYNTESVSEFIPVMEKESEVFLERMAHSEVSFGSEQLQNMIFRVVMKYTFGSYLSEANVLELSNLQQLAGTLLLEGLSNPFTALPFYKYLPTNTNRKLKELQARWRHFSKGYNERFDQEKLDKKSVFYKVKEQWAKRPDDLSEEEFLKTLQMSSIANVDIVTGTVGWLLFHLAFYTEVQQKLEQEVRNNLSELKHGDALNAQQLSRVEYAGHVIRESARVRPMVPSSIPEYVSSPMEIGDYICPAGVDVSIDNVALNMDPHVWPHPEKFDPQRFNNETPIMRKSLCRFGIGTRKCLGYRLAETFMKVLLVTLARSYSLSLTSDVTQDDDHVSSLNVGPFPFPNVKFKIKRK